MPPTPSPTTLLLVRHGQTTTTGKVLPGRARGLHLAAAGRAQAERAAARLATLSNVGAVYTSPLERTRETAAPIAAALGQRVTVERGLVECDFGAWTGQRLRTLMRKPEWRTIQSAPSRFRFPDGESFVEMQQRIVATVERLAAAHPGEQLVAVSHADPIKALLAHCLGVHLDLFQRIVVSPCSVSAVLLTPGNAPVVLCVNSIGGELSELTPS